MDRQRGVWLIDSRGLAKKVIDASLPAEDQIKDCGATRQCPNCLTLIDNSDADYEWPGFPAGVKFDPSDVELLDHLASKRGEGSVEPHELIDHFIRSIEGDQGICYTHPENLPGAKKDGTSVYFFHRIKQAYTSGKRKRRRIEVSMNSDNVRWHKTGKTKPVMENKVQKGFKKIMVLYAKGGSKPEKCNWVMHQYHLGTDEDEKDGEFVVSKIFHQPRKETEKNEACMVGHEIPTTPGTVSSDLTRLEKTPSSDCISDYLFMQPIVEEGENLKDLSHVSYDTRLEEEIEYAMSNWGPGTIDLTSHDNNEMVHSLDDDDDDLRPRMSTFAQVGVETSGVLDTLSCRETDLSLVKDGLGPRSSSMAQDGGEASGENNSCGREELDNLELDTPPDFDLNELTIFLSQDSVLDYLDQL